MLEGVKSKISGLKDKTEDLIMSKIDLIMIELPNAVSLTGIKLQQFWNNEEQVRTVFSIVHESMPLPFRLAINEDRFVNFCVQHKKKIQLMFESQQNDASLDENADAQQVIQKANEDNKE